MPEDSELSEWLLSRLGTSEAREHPSSSANIGLMGGELELPTSEAVAVDGVVEPCPMIFSRVIIIYFAVLLAVALKTIVEALAAYVAGTL